MSNTIARSLNQEVFCIRETTKGTLVAPTAASLVVPNGFINATQPAAYTDSGEVNGTRDVTYRFRDRFGAGTWFLPMYLRPSGTAGVAPDGDVLFEGLFGTKTIVADTSVTYSQALTKPSHSLWYRKDHTVFWARGCTVNKADLALAISGGSPCDFAGEFMEQGYAGTDMLNGAALIAATDIIVDNAKKYTVGSLTEFVDASDGTTYNNTAAGYQVTAVNIATNTVTISPGLEHALADDSVIRGWLPTGVAVGIPLPARKGKALIASTETVVNAMSVSISDPAKMLADEITTTDYPEDYAEGQREITGSTEMYFRENDLEYLYDAQNAASTALGIVVGDTAGSIVTLSLPYSTIDIPTYSDNPETVTTAMGFKSIGSAGNDSATLAFT